MRNKPVHPPPDREATIAEWLRLILEEGHKAQAVTLRWRKHNRGLSEAAYAAWVRELKQRLRAGPGALKAETEHGAAPAGPACTTSRRASRPPARPPAACAPAPTPC